MAPTDASNLSILVYFLIVVIYDTVRLLRFARNDIHCHYEELNDNAATLRNRERHRRAAVSSIDLLIIFNILSEDLPSP